MLQRLLPLLFLCLPLLAQADDATTQVEELLQSVPKGETPENQKLRESYQQALQFARDAERYRTQGKAYQQLMIDYPKESARLKDALHNYQPVNRVALASLSEDALRQALGLSSSRQLNLRKERQALLDGLNQQEITGQEFHLRIDELRKQLQQTRAQLDRMSFSGESDRLHEAQQLMTRLKEQSLSDRIQMLELEQLSAQQRSDLAKLKVQGLNLAITDEDEWQNALVNQQNQLRRKNTERTLAESERLQAQLTADMPLLQEQQQQNQTLSIQLGALEERIEGVQDEQRDVDNSLSHLNDLVNSVREQLEWLQISNAYGENLRSKLADLPALFPLDKLESAIVQSRIAKYRYEGEQEALKDPAKVRDQLLKEEDKLDRAQLTVLDNLLKTRRLLLTRLNDAADTLIQEQTRLKLLYIRQNSKIDEIRELSASHLFWLPDVPPLTPAVLLGVPAALGLALDPANWWQLPLALSEGGATRLTFIVLALLLLFVTWIRLARHLSHFSQQIAPRVGKVTQDKFSLTSRLLLRSLMAALPLPAMALLLRYQLAGAWQYPFAIAIAKGLGEIWFLLLALLLVRHLTLEKGILIHHFGWNGARVARVWGQFRTLLLILIPSFFVQGMADSYQEHAFYDTLGRLAFMVGALWLLLFFVRLNRERLPLTWGQADMNKPHLLHHFIWNALMLAPLVAVVGALLGYFYTSRTLLRQLEVSLLMGLGCLLVYYLARRWMLIQRRRLAFERAKSRRAEILAQRGREEQDDLSSEIPDVVEEQELDLDTISAQSLGLIRTLLMLGFTMLLVVQWSDLNSAFSFLSNIEVWQVSSKVAGIEQLSAITLQDLMLTLFVFILTVMTARNLPGLMELTLLQHLSLSPGTGFALTTVSKYLVILIGALTGFSMLGIDWSKTQWLVAALSVGLGFGLQEIFANFVSGLIILFEKPIRLGDTVTIRDLTGTVSKIKTRATTIVDWDRKEIIVPNKAFITEQFINWSLSDAITRVKLRIRIGLTQDPKRVQHLLEQCVQESSLVLDTPTPEVFLIEFTDSALIYEIRLYVNNMDHRMPITHEVHSAILEKLHALGMHLPHQQIDIRMSRG
ncbi:miniconductance mechanosensitive channel MscM [Aeromonas bivalvium]|uniref:miniconductance mechanosensitive channel MscM n=1 Tax=Aeromonas bivalvium TaxID=440079 RepID=UPI0038D21F2E